MNAAVLLDPEDTVLSSLSQLMTITIFLSTLRQCSLSLVGDDGSIDAPFMTEHTIDAYSPHLTSCESLSSAQRLFSDEDCKVH